ncbi:hypothetical protein ACO22_02832 [Paracoccidioides brasiliensis]|uniref:Uncharacterized protein n=1 Tax=Paracoccidioides brasiliensis TaxID=121759 RepID=A0A1D2JHV5_PARBR|nr:hypothetical protein ACO22_02832 [Paracoccidioides brasiliensis]
MPRTRRLLKKEITYSLAKERRVNILHELGYDYYQQTRFFSHLSDKRVWMKDVIIPHLGLRSTEIPGRASSNRDNVSPFDFLFHIVLGRAFGMGIGDEKIQCEAGAYAWL